MDIQVSKCGLTAIDHLRKLFLQENNVQFVHNKCHLYGWADTWLFTSRGEVAGYGSVWGREQRQDRDAICEFYLLPVYRKQANAFFIAFRQAANTPYIDCQTNLGLMATMFFEHAKNIYAEAILFEDHFVTRYPGNEMVFTKKLIDDEPNPDCCRYQVMQEQTVWADGGLMLNYNFPFADIYYDVQEAFRRRGVATYMVQELKGVAYAMGRVPAARCSVSNINSKATLLKAGMRVCGYLLQGELS